MIVLDTSTWLHALRRHRGGPPHRAAGVLRSLVQEGTPIAVPGIVLQELLSGAQTREQFERLEGVLQPFTVLLPTREHHVVAARIAHTCRANGVATTTPDTLVATTTILAGGTLLTWDADFTHIAQLVPMGLRLERD